MKFQKRKPRKPRPQHSAEYAEEMRKQMYSEIVNAMRNGKPYDAIIDAYSITMAPTRPGEYK